MKYKKSVFRSLAMVTQLGLCVLTPVLLAVLAGHYIDSRFGIRTTLVLLILGVLGGGRGAYLMAKRLAGIEDREEKAERERRLREAVENPLTATSRPKIPSRVRGASAGPAEFGRSRDDAVAQSEETAGCSAEQAFPGGSGAGPAGQAASFANAATRRETPGVSGTEPAGQAASFANAATRRETPGGSGAGPAGQVRSRAGTAAGQAPGPARGKEEPS